MKPFELLSHIEAQGLELYLDGQALRYRASIQPNEQILKLIKENKFELIQELKQKKYLPKLPWKLERLVSASSASLLTLDLVGVKNPNTYTLAWAAAYLTGDRQEALKRLTTVYQEWEKEQQYDNRKTN